MKIHHVVLFAIAVLLPSLGVAGDDRASMQQKLDAECEAARERKLEPEREMYVQECVQQKMKRQLAGLPALLRRLWRENRRQSAALLRSARNASPRSNIARAIGSSSQPNDGGYVNQRVLIDRITDVLGGIERVGGSVSRR